MTAPNIIYYGTPQPLPERRILRAGPLSMIYEQGDLRYIKLGEREILRRIYVAIRDRNWGTVPPVFSKVQMRVGDDAFEISYEVGNRQNEIDFAWKGTITGNAEGTISFSMDGEARATFLRNRIGFCVLHPIRECAGARCIIQKVDGSTEQATFPVYIAPHQPFLDMRSISHEVLPGVWADVCFEGDIFEMEDQRAWIDASYKTYCTPLQLPYPAEIRKGTRVHQSITLTLRGQLPQQSVSTLGEGEPVRISSSNMLAIPLPRIGLGMASHGQPLTEREVARLRALNLSHLRVDLRLSQSDYAQKLKQAAEEGRRLGIPLEAAVFLSEDTETAEGELKALAGLLPEIEPTIWAWLVFPAVLKSTTETLIHMACHHLSAYNPSARFGGGTNVYFAELNRDRPTPGTMALLDFMNYSANPQVHAFDNASVAETCEALASTVDSAVQFAQGKPLSISPITLRPRFNAVATGPEPAPPPGELPRQVDPRQMSLFGACWTLGSLKYIAESGRVQHVTYYETTGWRGVMETEAGSPLPGKFPSQPGCVFPMYHVLADIAEFRRGEVIPVQSSDPLRINALLLRKASLKRLILANMDAEAHRVLVRNVGGQATLRTLDETNVEDAICLPETFRDEPNTILSSADETIELTLYPYAIACVDITAQP